MFKRVWYSERKKWEIIKIIWKSVIEKLNKKV